MLFINNTEDGVAILKASKVLFIFGLYCIMIATLVFIPDTVIFPLYLTGLLIMLVYVIKLGKLEELNKSSNLSNK